MTEFLNSIEDTAINLRRKLEQKNFVLLFAHNGTGKTRLSMAFKDVGRIEGQRDTLYFNAFTEDLFSWDNDLDSDSNRLLKLNKNSYFFVGLDQLEMENRIRPILNKYANFDFKIDYENWTVSFKKEILIKDANGNEKNTWIENIKISRGEENIFIFCFFIAVFELALKDDGTGPYGWVKYIFVDDPISSLDDNNAIAMGTHLAQLLLSHDNRIKAVISTHHALFFNVMYYGLKNKKFFSVFFQTDALGKFKIEGIKDSPFFQHIALLNELQKVTESGRIFTYHFNILRSILEKTASFLGYEHFSKCLVFGDSEDERELYKRSLDVLSHGKYSLFDPIVMVDDNKVLFNKILKNFIRYYKFSTDSTSVEELE